MQPANHSKSGNLRRPHCLVAFALCVLALAQHGTVAEPVAPREPARYAVVVGIDKYQDEAFAPVPGAAADAVAIAQALRECAGFRAENVTLLTTRGKNEEQPTANNIRSALAAWRDKVGPEDIVFFMFCGHGMARGDDSYLVPCDADSREENIQNTAVRVDRLNGIIKALPVRAAITVFDIRHQNALVAKAIESGGNGESDMHGYMVGTSRSLVATPQSLLQVFSCGAAEKSYRDPATQRSYFSYYLEEGLRGAARESNRAITALQLFAYVVRKVTGVGTSAGQAQKPWFKATGSADFDFVPALALQRTWATLNINSEPPNAEVLQNGIRTGHYTPCSLSVDTTEKRVFDVALPGFKSALLGSPPDLQAGRRYTLRFKLTKPDTAIIALQSDPPHASVFLNGELQPVVTPCDVEIPFKASDKARKVKIKLQAGGPNLMPLEREVTIAPGAVTKIEDLKFVPWPSAKLRLTAPVPGTRVRLDGREVDIATPQIIPLQDFHRQVWVEGVPPRGYLPFVQRATVTNGVETPLTVALQPLPPTRVTVISEPAGAKIVVTPPGRPAQAGTSSVACEVPAGKLPAKVKVSVSKAGSAPRELLLDLPLAASGKSQRMVVNLDPARAQLTVTSNPSGAAVAIDGVAQGRVTPCHIDVPLGKLPKRTATVTVSLENYESRSMKADLVPGKPTVLPAFNLASTTLTVLTRPPGARVSFPGLNIPDQLTPITGLLLPARRHGGNNLEMRIALDGYVTKSITVPVAPGHAKTLPPVDLSPLPVVTFVISPPAAVVAIKDKPAEFITGEMVTLENGQPALKAAWQAPPDLQDTSVGVTAVAHGFKPFSKALSLSTDLLPVVLEPQSAKLRVTSIPPGATIRVGRQEYKKVNQIDVEEKGAHSHSVTISAELGGKTQERKVVVSPGDALEVNFFWTALKWIAVTSKPAGANISIDGISCDVRTPCKLAYDPGDQARQVQFTAALNPYQVGSQAVPVGKNLSAIEIPVPDAPPARLKVVSSPAGAAVTVHPAIGKPLSGVAPLECPVPLDASDLKPVLVRVEMKGFKTWEQEIRLEPGQEFTANATLNTLTAEAPAEKR